MFKIYDGRSHFYQWDIDRKLIVEDASISEVHFCNQTDNYSLVCKTYIEDGLNLVNVPNILLQNDWRINVYAYDSNYTKFSEQFDVIRRCKPEDYVYTETEILNYNTLSDRITKIEEGGGITPTIGDNGNWYLGSTDTGKPSRGETGARGEKGDTGATGATGADGKSAYSYAQDGGYIGTEAEFAAKLAAEKLPNPYPLTFTGAVSETYDGSSAKTIEIPSGGSGETATPELLYSGTAENVSAFQQNIDMKGHRRFCVIVGGTKGESAISISNGFFYLGEKEYKIFYYTDWLGATSESYPEGCVTEHFTLMDQDKIAITYQQITTSLNGISNAFQGNSSQFIAPKLAVLKGKNVAKEDGITLSFSAVVKSVTVYVFGY